MNSMILAPEKYLPIKVSLVICVKYFYYRVYTAVILIVIKSRKSFQTRSRSLLLPPYTPNITDSWLCDVSFSFFGEHDCRTDISQVSNR